MLGRLGCLGAANENINIVVLVVTIQLAILFELLLNRLRILGLHTLN